MARVGNLKPFQTHSIRSSFSRPTCGPFARDSENGPQADRLNSEASSPLCI